MENLRNLEAIALEKAQLWADDPYLNREAKEEIQKLLKMLESKDDKKLLEAKKEIFERFYRDLEFGTGGIRGILGMGINRINKYTIHRATMALSLALLKHYSKTKEIKVAISYDTRKYSFEFAKETASVLAGYGIHSYIYKTTNPVSLLSFSVRYHQAHAGVMITASHNPPQYNGYKVYWNDGAQVTPPYDQEIIDFYYKNPTFNLIKKMDLSAAEEKKLIHWVGKEVEDEYYKLIHTKVLSPQMCREKGKNLKIVYSPLHGTGLLPCTRLLTEMGFTNVHVVPEQAQPDSDFPTVKKGPNPENPEALSMAVELMRKTNADIVFATDPDTDRLGVAIIDQGNVFYPNGNQIGILMFYYIAHQLKSQNKMPANPYMVKTIVTTRMLDIIAKKFGVEVESTLTGFKWICRSMGDIDKNYPEKSFIFSTEESFGYMHHNFVRDKDGVSSLGLMAEVALWYKEQGLNLAQALDQIYLENGLCLENLLSLDYFGKEGADKIQRLMSYFRSTFQKNGQTSFCDEAIIEIEDYSIQKSVHFEKDAETILQQPKSNVLGINFKSGHRLCARPSGTEPKIKFYIMIVAEEGDLAQKKAFAQKKIDQFRQAILEIAEKA